MTSPRIAASTNDHSKQSVPQYGSDQKLPTSVGHPTEMFRDQIAAPRRIRVNYPNYDSKTPSGFRNIRSAGGDGRYASGRDRRGGIGRRDTGDDDRDRTFLVGERRDDVSPSGMAVTGPPLRQPCHWLASKPRLHCVKNLNFVPCAATGPTTLPHGVTGDRDRSSSGSGPRPPSARSASQLIMHDARNDQLLRPVSF
jgi:hypothetical protein